MSERQAPTFTAEKQKVDEVYEDSLQQRKTMDDLPPEVVENILEHLVNIETSRNNLLGYRVVNSKWKNILKPLLEKKVLSGKLQTFPVMKICEHPNQINVYCSPLFFQAANAPFPDKSLLPANSLFLNGSLLLQHRRGDTKKSLPTFLSQYGATLTSLTIQDIVVTPTAFAAMLASIPSLKVLRIADVQLMKRDTKPTTILLPPPLPSLTTMEVKSSAKAQEKNAKRNRLYIWLVASYANQLECLNLNTNIPFPAIRPSHNYSFRLGSRETVSIASTSESAFQKLNTLKIYHPTYDFLHNSKTTTLKRLSIASSDNQTFTDLQNVIQFVVRHRNTLEQLCLNGSWSHFLRARSLADIQQRVGQQQQIGRPVVSKVKTLAVHYPSLDFQEKIICEELLVRFPALEVLQLLNYQPRQLQREIPTDREEMEVDEDEMGRAEVPQRHLEEVIVKQLLERLRISTLCPNLKVVSVCSGEKPEGDVCVIQRGAKT